LLHNDGIDKTKKDEAFRHFVWEGEKISEIEFCLSYRWLNTGGIKLSSGNLDSQNVFLEKIAIDSQERKIFSTIESMVINIVREFQAISQEGGLQRDGRMVMTATEEELVARFGDEIGHECAQTLRWHLETFKKPDAQS
jgi:hypothetical protein